MAADPSPTRHRIRHSQVFALVVCAAAAFAASAWEAHPVRSALLFGAGCVLVGLGTVGRLWCAVFIAGYKRRSLVTTGPYSMCRNPLYFFSFLGALGVGFATRTLTIPVVVAAGFALYYPAVVRAEQRSLREQYGDAYDAYAARVPAFWLRIRLLEEPETYVVDPRRLRRSVIEALWFVWLVGVIEIVGGLRAIGILPTWWTLY